MKKSKSNSEKIWKIQKKRKLKCEMIWKIWKKPVSRAAAAAATTTSITTAAAAVLATAVVAAAVAAARLLEKSRGSDDHCTELCYYLLKMLYEKNIRNNKTDIKRNKKRINK